jgi:hypothetical protein
MLTHRQLIVLSGELPASSFIGVGSHRRVHTSEAVERQPPYDSVVNPDVGVVGGDRLLHKPDVMRGRLCVTVGSAPFCHLGGVAGRWTNPPLFIPIVPIVPTQPYVEPHSHAAAVSLVT